jgi:2-amino-4-hydroxy-6-hydroxymethyldihydropteridine diphosphokinase
MIQWHRYYLSLGSNIQPETHLSMAIDLLRGHGEVTALSSAWESRPVGSEGPNYLNVCVAFGTPLNQEQCVRLVLRPIEAELGRVRTGDKNAPRTIDIDLLIIDGRPVNAAHWANAFVLLPMSELLPDLKHPISKEPLRTAAQRAEAETWIERRREALRPANGKAKP